MVTLLQPVKEICCGKKIYRRKNRRVIFTQGKKPVQIIIHIATTNIAGNKYRGKTANEMPIELAKYFKTSKTNLVVSSVVPSKAQLNNKQQSKRSQRTFKR